MTFVALIHISYDGDLQHFCNDVNNFLKSVSDDLQPLDKGIIPDVSYRPHEFVIFPYQVESKLSKIMGANLVVLTNCLIGSFVNFLCG